MTNKKKKKSNELSTIVLYYLIALILLLIGILHNYTGILGEFIYNCFFYVFGIFAVAILIVIFILLVVDMYLSFNRSKKINKLMEFLSSYNFIVSFILICLGVLILLTIPKNQSLKGFEYIKLFFTNSKSIFTNHLIPNYSINDYSLKGGMIGILLYGLITQYSTHIASIITSVVLFVAALIIDAYYIKKTFNTINNKVNDFSNSLAKKKEKRQAEKAMIAKEKAKKVTNDKFFADVKTTKKEETSTTKYKHEKNSNNNKEEVSSYKQTDVAFENKTIAKNYQLPGLNLLDNTTRDKEKDARNKENARNKWMTLSSILESFDLASSLKNLNIGPSVTQFEVAPDTNFNIKKFANIKESLQMGLAVKELRIEAPIPGKSAVGFEIPNIERVNVKLKELLTSIPEQYQNEPLLMALGKCLDGSIEFDKISRMPHLLVAGATGSGKSVCINSIIMTLLLRTRPDDVKLILIDPKKVEFTVYQQVPHLLCPIVTDTNKAANTLKKLVDKMEQRYTTFQNSGVRSITEYNKKFPQNKMCNIVCIIDELADLMLLHKSDVEVHISRLAAKARAAGIFLILATQRPSTDVITGTIKANIPSRIAFSVSSSIDSRIILDRTGAEDLIGNGDMFFSPIGSTTPIRVQGVYVSDDEINRVVNYLKKSGYTPSYDDYFMIEDEDEENPLASTMCEDPMYPQIKQYVMTQKTISASALQRRYSLGFPRAGKIIDALEADGIIGPNNGSKPREVLVAENIE